jgi:hypothetical protein
MDKSGGNDPRSIRGSESLEVNGKVSLQFLRIACQTHVTDASSDADAELEYYYSFRERSASMDTQA